jgi:hypothetical protein
VGGTFVCLSKRASYSRGGIFDNLAENMMAIMHGLLAVGTGSNAESFSCKDRI